MFSWKPEPPNTSGASLTFARARTRMFHAQHRTRSWPSAGWIRVSNPQETARGMKRQAVLRSATMSLIGCRKLDLAANDSIFDPLTPHQQSLRFDRFESSHSRHLPTSSSLPSCYEYTSWRRALLHHIPCLCRLGILAQWFVDRLKVGYVELDPLHDGDPMVLQQLEFRLKVLSLHHYLSLQSEYRVQVKKPFGLCLP